MNETLRRDPAGESPARQRLATSREPSVAWYRGNPSCEAYTGSEQAASMSPERREIVRADAVYTAEGRTESP